MPPKQQCRRKKQHKISLECHCEERSDAAICSAGELIVFYQKNGRNGFPRSKLRFSFGMASQGDGCWEIGQNRHTICEIIKGFETADEIEKNSVGNAYYAFR